jgi:hypothetical protein
MNDAQDYEMQVQKWEPNTWGVTKITNTHIYPAAPTLGVCKNMPFSTKNLSPTLGEDPKRFLGFQINAPRL